ncbi:DUF4436 domain-containing protein [Mycobacterium montefiorense]|uniref:DUF4436 domain-containing protein n=1 Tax=Mycobacterium montefiorense TaxID=154654 RepID=A0AA37UX96_9MYCO|nr:DUF4436 domain-containing protein [Mycobacterium montefiorense]GBG36963.1 DUF4436 domain-containing protein [Mycobacterium montefiorense]GKU37869.1 DUF4436 domain-containing protein [Mycobacterium montefiorense]GKU42507.1 DUF4436 domain-containing protein [Mycobacterium montefiorense]GKU46295.1 DUF4436 domain-containing protein [Mycobacterium montefiorense]GKU51121.1 DUF4436 domain-containing protein [Mycobacterium montefiorense]
MTTETPQAPAPPQPDQRKSAGLFGYLGRHRPRISLGAFILAIVIGAYGFSLFGVHYLQRSAGPLPPLDLSQGGGNDTIVQLRLDDFKTTANRLKVDVLVYPPDSLYDKRFDVLNTDVAVRLYPTNDLGDLQFPKGKAPAQVETTIEAHGDPANWPFDTYRTEKISADTFIGSGDDRKKIPARVEVTGGLDGWDVDVNRVDETSDVNSRGLDDAQLVITMKRAKGPLVFDMFICIVLITLPTLALLVAIPMAMGKRKFVPPFGTWYAAMLFAIVPLRNILPGSPPPGSWIDQAVVQWVLIALVVAMSLYIFSWVRQGD